MEERWGWRGTVDITVMRAGQVVKRDTLRNLITDAAKDALVGRLRGSIVDDMQITYVALGTDDTTPAGGDTTLGAEVFRKQVTAQAAAGTGKARTTLFVAPDDYSGAVAEIGWFAGDATGVADSGLLVARVLWSHTLTSLESVQIERVDDLGGA